MKKLSDLSTSFRLLVELMQEVNFGQIENLCVRDGEPCFEPAPIVVNEVIFGKENGNHPMLRKTDFILKSQVVELLERLSNTKDATIRCLVVQNGLPVRMKLENTFRV